MLAASAAFRAAPNATAAADVVGAMLARWHYIAIGAPLLLFALELRRVRRFVLVLLFAAIAIAAAQALVDLRIRAIRETSPVPISALDSGDPIRRRFGALHGFSMMLLLAQAIAAAAVVMSKKDKEDLPMPDAEPRDDVTYKVIRNVEDYTVWPADRPSPPEWHDAGVQGTKQECLDWIRTSTGVLPKSEMKTVEKPGGSGPTF
jgi:MbtH protein